MACTLGVMPVSLFTFHTLQPLAPLANLWMAPLVEGLLPVGLGLAGLDLLSPQLGHLLGMALIPWLWLVEQSAHAWARLSPQCEVPNPGPLGWLAWLSLLGLIWLGPRLATIGWAAALSWITLLPAQPPAPLRLRWLWLGSQPCCWLSQSPSQAVLLTTNDQRSWAERMRLAHGLAPYDHMLSLQDPCGRWPWAQGWLESQPGRLSYHQGGVSLGLVLKEHDWDGLSWGMDSTGQWVWAGGQPQPIEKGQPWQLWLVDRQFCIEPWRIP